MVNNSVKVHANARSPEEVAEADVTTMNDLQIMVAEKTFEIVALQSVVAEQEVRISELAEQLDRASRQHHAGVDNAASDKRIARLEKERDSALLQAVAAENATRQQQSIMAADERVVRLKEERDSALQQASAFEVAEKKQLAMNLEALQSKADAEERVVNLQAELALKNRELAQVHDFYIGALTQQNVPLEEESTSAKFSVDAFALAETVSTSAESGSNSGAESGSNSEKRSLNSTGASDFGSGQLTVSSSASRVCARSYAVTNNSVQPAPRWRSPKVSVEERRRTGVLVSVTVSPPRRRMPKGKQMHSSVSPVRKIHASVSPVRGLHRTGSSLQSWVRVRRRAVPPSVAVETGPVIRSVAPYLCPSGEPPREMSPPRRRMGLGGKLQTSVSVSPTRTQRPSMSGVETWVRRRSVSPVRAWVGAQAMPCVRLQAPSAVGGLREAISSAHSQLSSVGWPQMPQESSAPVFVARAKTRQQSASPLRSTMFRVPSVVQVPLACSPSLATSPLRTQTPVSVPLHNQLLAKFSSFGELPFARDTTSPCRQRPVLVARAKVRQQSVSPLRTTTLALSLTPRSTPLQPPCRHLAAHSAVEAFWDLPSLRPASPVRVGNWREF